MKIALMAFRYGPSHGSILQIYALVRILEKMGHHVYVIDRQSPITWRNYKKCIKKIVTDLMRGKLRFNEYYLDSFSPLTMTNLNLFIDQHFRYQTITVRSEEKLRKLGISDYDAFIVGSDQTWRPKYVYNIFDYFLEFVPTGRKVKRIAYAPSFGTSDWEYTPEQEKKCRNLISLFDRVSVREQDGVALCRTHLNVDAVHVLDPTMLLQALDYKCFVLNSNLEKYIGYNLLDFTDKKLRLVEKLKKELNLPICQLISMGDKRIKNEQEKIPPTIENWLSGIANSEYMVVDSYHATVFCILFHKPFLTIANKERGLSRFVSLLKSVGLENRLVDIDESNRQVSLTDPIDWNGVDELVGKLRERSMRFLYESLL